MNNIQVITRVAEGFLAVATTGVSVLVFHARFRPCLMSHLTPRATVPTPPVKPPRARG
jgi:hypothetical protein